MNQQKSEVIQKFRADLNGCYHLPKTLAETYLLHSQLTFKMVIVSALENSLPVPVEAIFTDLNWNR